ncbi:MAG: hypothetical protein K5877_05030 [Lachnospiraceae bacterium]|nr:hypothetical protein [Lachnospiraceae bacterium]
MDSKLVKIGMLIVSLFAVTVLLIVLGINGRFSGSSKNKNGSQVTADVPAKEEYDPESHLYDWMNDETFFDEVKLADGKYEVKEEKKADFLVSCIDKDIRIVVLDEEGKVIKGRRFCAGVEGLGEYGDEDRDGMILINDLSPGDYSISMEDITGYAFPENPVKISVKANIEYKAVKDISYLIKTEADIDVKKEDTAEKDADDETLGTTAVKTTQGAVFGIDVSKYNGDIDWQKVADEGVSFAIIRCGYRGSSSGVIVEDPYYRRNIEGALKAGLDVGVYFFTQALDEKEAIEEASAVLSLLKGYKISYPIFIDSESAGGKGRADDLSVTARSKALQAFCETVRNSGKTAGIYASKNWFNNRLDISKLSADNITWLAEYADKPTYGATYQIWQYSSAGRIPGIEGRVDMNLSYLDIDVSDDKNTSRENDEDGQDISRDM